MAKMVTAMKNVSRTIKERRLILKTAPSICLKKSPSRTRGSAVSKKRQRQRGPKACGDLFKQGQLAKAVLANYSALMKEME